MDEKERYFKLLGEECFNHLKEVNPKGGIKTFIRLAVKYGYDAALKVTNNSDLAIGTKVVITGNTNRHEFEIGETVVIDQGIDVDGDYRCVRELGDQEEWWVNKNHMEIINVPNG